MWRIGHNMTVSNCTRKKIWMIKIEGLNWRNSHLKKVDVIEIRKTKTIQL